MRKKSTASCSTNIVRASEVGPEHLSSADRPFECKCVCMGVCRSGKGTEVGQGLHFARTFAVSLPVRASSKSRNKTWKFTSESRRNEPGKVI